MKFVSAAAAAAVVVILIVVLGCGAESTPTEVRSDCDPSYPGVCIPAYPPDLDCGDIPHRRFQVTGSDPHGFDRDRDGIGCESNR